MILGWRLAGQAFIKVDNDVVLPGGDWVTEVEALIAHLEAPHNRRPGRSVAMVGGYYPDLLYRRSRGVVDTWKSGQVWSISPVIGHAVYHTGAFMDAVGYFDVLSDAHLYGFEDLIMSVKANALGWLSVTWEGWAIENIQRENSLGAAGRDAHITAMRPLYEARIRALQSVRTLYTGPNGRPLPKEAYAEALR